MATRGLVPEVAQRLDALLRRARSAGIDARVTSTFRSRAQQEALFRAWIARGRTGLPAAVPGSSTHEYGFAVDIVSSRPEALARLAECVGLKWAGPRDRVHFDVWGPVAWRELLADRPLPAGFGYDC